MSTSQPPDKRRYCPICGRRVRVREGLCPTHKKAGVSRTVFRGMAGARKRRRQKIIADRVDLFGDVAWLSANGSVVYKKYIESNEWKTKRQQVIARDKRTCQLCGNLGSHVHHLTYERIGHEDLADLQLLCVSCHKKQHPEKAF